MRMWMLQVVQCAQVSKAMMQHGFEFEPRQLNAIELLAK